MKPIRSAFFEIEEMPYAIAFAREMVRAGRSVEIVVGKMIEVKLTL